MAKKNQGTDAPESGKKGGRRGRARRAAGGSTPTADDDRADSGGGASRRRGASRGGAKGAAGPSVEIPLWVPWVLYPLLGVVLFREFVFSDLMLVGNDTLGLGYVARAFYAEALANGTFPLWAPRILGGTPFLEALSAGDSLYPPSVALLMLLDTHRALGWKLILHIMAAGFLMFAWVRTLGASRAAAHVAGAGYMLAPMLVGFVHPGHDGKLFVMALAPLMFWTVERFFAHVRPTAPRFAAIGLVIALVISTTHFQMAYFLFLATGMYALFRAVQMGRGTDAERTGRGTEAAMEDEACAARRPNGWAPAGTRFGLFLAASVAGAAGMAVQLLPAVEYVTEFSRRTQTTAEDAGERGLEWSAQFSIHPEEAMSLLIPEFAGNNAGGAAWAENTYWGRNGFKDNHENAGLILMVLAAVAFVGGRRRGLRWFMLGLGTVAFLFALGANTPVWRIFYEVVPGIRLFRAPSQAMFLFVFATTTLAALGVDRLLEYGRGRGERRSDEGGDRRVFQVLLAWSAVMGLLLLLSASGGLLSFWTETIWPGLDPSRIQRLSPFVVRGAFIGLVLVGCLAGAAWLYRNGVVKPLLLVAVLAGLVIVDALRIDTAFVTTMDFYEWSRPDALMQTVLSQEAGSDEPYRLYSTVRRSQDVQPTLHGIEIAAGHHPNDLARYRDLIGMVGSGEARNMGNPNIRRILNVKYILWSDYEEGGSLGGQPLAATQLRDGRAYQSLYADLGLPRARLVGSAVVKSDAEAVDYILSDGHDPTVEAVLSEESPPVTLAGRPVSGSVRWVERSPNRMEWSVESDGPALLVLADNWFPAWKARIDGQEVPVLRAYHTLRAVPVPAGSSTVVMTYESAALVRSAWLSALVLLGLAAAALSGIVKRKREDGSAS